MLSIRLYCFPLKNVTQNNKLSEKPFQTVKIKLYFQHFILKPFFLRCPMAKSMWKFDGEKTLDEIYQHLLSNSNSF
jgi:hypothetical protein